jgi:MFS family permease
MTSDSKKFQWIVLLPVSLFLFFDFVQLNIMSSVGPLIMKIIPISSSSLGLISSLFFLVNLILLFPAGIALDKFNVKWPVILSIFITDLGIFSFATNQNIYFLVIWRVCSGFAGAFSYISCVKLLAESFRRKYLGLLLGLTGIVIMSAGVAVQYPLLKLISWVGLANSLYLNALFGLIVILFVYRFADYNTHVKMDSCASKEKVFLNSKNIIIGLYACLTNFPLFILGALWGNLYLIHTHNFSLESASLISSLIFIGNMVGAPSLGSLSDMFKNRIYLMIFSGILMLFSSTMIMLLYANQSLLVFSILFFLLGFSTGSQTLAYALIVDTNKLGNVAKATSMLSFLSVSGGFLVQPLFGLIIQSSHTENYYRGMYVILISALMATLLVCFLAIKKTNQNDALFEGSLLGDL